MSELALSNTKATTSSLESPASTSASNASEAAAQFYSELQPLTVTEAQSFQSFAKTMQSVQGELKQKNPNNTQIDNQLSQAIKDADGIDRKTVQTDATLAQKALDASKKSGNTAETKELTQVVDLYNSMLQASAQARIAKGDFDLNQKDYSTAKSLYEAAQKIDPTYANSKSVDVGKLIGEAHAPSFWDKLEHFGEDVLTGAVTVGASVLGGVVGSVIGPEGTVLGAALGGSLAFTGTQALEGKKVSWYTPLEGAGLGLLSVVPIIGEGADAAATTGATAAEETTLDTLTQSAASEADTALTESVTDGTQTGLRGLVQTARSYLPRTSISQKVVRHVASSVAIGTSGAAASSLNADSEAATVYADANSGAQNYQTVADESGNSDESTLSRVKDKFEGYFNRQPVDVAYMNQSASQLSNEGKMMGQQLAGAGGDSSLVAAPETSELPMTPNQLATMPNEYQLPPTEIGGYGSSAEFSTSPPLQETFAAPQTPVSDYQLPSTTFYDSGYEAGATAPPAGFASTGAQYAPMTAGYPTTNTSYGSEQITPVVTQPAYGSEVQGTPTQVVGTP